MKEANPFLRAALFYAQRLGWPVFPLAPRSKVPLISKEKGGHGCLDATTDEKQILKWWKQQPKANIGIRTNVVFWALDIDPKNGGEESRAMLVSKHGALQDTLRQRTGGGGAQYLYLPDERIIKGDKGVWPGIDVRAKNNYITVPPSIHPETGAEYIWDTAKKTILEEPINPANPWLIEELARYARNGNKEYEQLKKPEKFPKGKQQKILVSISGVLRNLGLTGEEIDPLLQVVNQNRCSSPGEPDKIRQYAYSMDNYPPQHALEELGATKTKRDAPPPGPAHEPWPEHEPPPLVAWEEAREVYRADIQDPVAILEPLLYPGLTILAGRPKSGKSWLVLQLAIALINKLKFANYLTVQKECRVGYVSLEDGKSRLRKRLRQLVMEESYLEKLKLAYKLAPLMTGGAAQLDKTLTDAPLDLLIIDSLLAAVQAAGRKNVDLVQTDYNIIGILREIAVKHSIAVLIVHHTRKAAGDSLDVVQGTTGTTAAADAVWVLRRTGDGKATLEITGKDVPQNTFGLERTQDSPAWIITGEGDEVTQSDARQDIIQLLRDKCGSSGKKDKNGKYIKPPAGLKPSQIAQALHKNISGINRLLAALLELGLVVKTGYGSYNLPGENEPPEAYEV